MSVKRTHVVPLVLCLVAALAGLALAAGPTRPPCGLSSTAGPEGPALQPQDVCSTVTPQTGPITNPTVQSPDQAAWQLFAQVNAPASGTVTFLTWANQADLYVGSPNPNDPPQWPVYKAPGTIRPAASRQHVERAAQLRSPHQAAASNPCMPAGTQEEVRVNPDTFKYVVQNKLWYIEGQIAAFNQGMTINFPTTSAEVKANWAPITEAQKGEYLWAVGTDGTLYGLVAMHVLSKAVPNWLWATFEHKSNPCYGKYLAPQDDFGFPNGSSTPSAGLQQTFKQLGVSPVFYNYRLDGAQVDFTDSEGSPIILGNSITENTFQTTASCMTCHSRSTVSPSTTGFGSGRLSVFRPDGQSYNGTPDPSWFWDFSTNPPTAKYLQLDFVWSLACANAVGSTGQNCPAPPV